MNVSPGKSGTIKVEQSVPPSYPATYTFSGDTEVYLEAVPAPGYRFDNWGGDLCGTTNPTTTIVVDCNKTITANFSPTTSRRVNWPVIGGVLGGLALVGGIVTILVIRH